MVLVYGKIKHFCSGQVEQSAPYVIFAKQGETIAFCMCGNSKNGPYCDGSHKGTGITPKVVTYEKETEIHACGCQQSKNRPMCDGTHKSLNQ